MEPGLVNIMDKDTLWCFTSLPFPWRAWISSVHCGLFLITSSKSSQKKRTFRAASKNARTMGQACLKWGSVFWERCMARSITVINFKFHCISDHNESGKGTTLRTSLVSGGEVCEEGSIMWFCSQLLGFRSLFLYPEELINVSHCCLHGQDGWMGWSWYLGVSSDNLHTG